VHLSGSGQVRLCASGQVTGVAAKGAYRHAIALLEWQAARIHVPTE
jgi:hypothetical protein